MTNNKTIIFDESIDHIDLCEEIAELSLVFEDRIDAEHVDWNMLAYCYLGVTEGPLPE